MQKELQTVEKDGKIEAVMVNGKNVKGSFMRGLKKAQGTSYWQMIPEETFVNPFSGQEVYLTGLEASIAKWVLSWYERYSSGNSTESPVQAYDDMKYFLLELNSEAYFALID